jgi:hypothetical protein
VMAFCLPIGYRVHALIAKPYSMPQHLVLSNLAWCPLVPS